MRKILSLFIFIILIFNSHLSVAQNDKITTPDTAKTMVFVFDINQNIEPIQ